MVCADAHAARRTNATAKDTRMFPYLGVFFVVVIESFGTAMIFRVNSESRFKPALGSLIASTAFAFRAFGAGKPSR